VDQEAFKMPLTALKISKVKPDAERMLLLFDGRGLYLEIARSGGKWWRLKYRIGGKEKRLSLGVYTAAGSNTVEVGLEAARKAAENARQLVRDGVDPSQDRKAEKLRAAHETGNTFEVVAREWLEKQSGVWASAHAERIVRLFERDIFPHIGGRPISEIEAPELLMVLRRIEGRDVAFTAHRARQYSGMVFRYGIATGRCQRDPASDLRGALAPVQEINFPPLPNRKSMPRYCALLTLMTARSLYVAFCASLRWSPWGLVSCARPNGRILT
jgi:Arm DNA-binding domain